VESFCTTPSGFVAQNHLPQEEGCWAAVSAAVNFLISVKIKAQFRLPCVKGGVIFFENDGGIVIKTLILNKKQPLRRLRRQLPLHRGAFVWFYINLYVT